MCPAGLPVTSVRELRVLQSCKHPNLVNLLKVVTGSKLDRCGVTAACLGAHKVFEIASAEGQAGFRSVVAPLRWAH